jgi:hypothetical protein
MKNINFNSILIVVGFLILTALISIDHEIMGTKITQSNREKIMIPPFIRGKIKRLKEQAKEDREKLNVALEYLEYKFGCPIDNSDIAAKIACTECSEDKEIWECWEKYLLYWEESKN